MEMLTTIIDAPSIEDMLATMSSEATSVARHKLRACDLRLYPDGTARLGNIADRILVAKSTVADFGHLVRIPQEYFHRCDEALRATSFNHFILSPDIRQNYVYVEIADGILSKILSTSLIPVPELVLFRLLRDSLPNFVNSSHVKVIKYHNRNIYDVSLISENLTCTPRVGDMVAFGINATTDTKGAIQIQSASYRLQCRNGAIFRVFANNEQRLRRPMCHTSRNEEYFNKIKDMASNAWQKWRTNAANTERLVTSPIYMERKTELRSVLRMSPFFLSAEIIKRVYARLNAEVEASHAGPTAYELWNALSYLGTHADDISYTLRSRLRRGAGELAHHATKTCSACKQLVVLAHKEKF